MCSSAARLRIRPALISDNAKLIRMRAEIPAEKMLPNQKGKQPEGVLKHLGLPRTLRLVEGTAAACEKHTQTAIDIIYCMVIAIHFSLLLGLVYKVHRCHAHSHPSQSSYAEQKYQNNAGAVLVHVPHASLNPCPHPLKTNY